MAELDERKIEEAWKNCNDILSHMATYSASASNTLKFLQASYTQSTSNYRQTKDNHDHAYVNHHHHHRAFPDTTDPGYVDNLTCFGQMAVSYSEAAFNWNDPAFTPDDLGFLGTSLVSEFPGWFADNAGIQEYENMMQ